MNRAARFWKQGSEAVDQVRKVSNNLGQATMHKFSDVLQKLMNGASFDAFH